MKLLFHVQHMLGVGHRVRAERIVHACAAAGFDVTLMEGGVPGQVPVDEDAGRIHRVQLPPARAADAAFSGVVDAETGLAIDDAWRARRKARTLETLAAVQPDILLVEGFPFARRAFRFELEPLVDAARSMDARTAVSIRDILVARPNRLKTAQIAETARCLFDIVFVHGDPNFVALRDSFSATAVLADRIRYTGIVAPSPVPITRQPDQGEVLVSAGGGATGGDLMRAALAARPLTKVADRPWRFLVGPNLPEADRAVLAAAPAGVIVEPARSDFQSLLASAALSISQAGYNTVADIAVTGCPAVLVPFEGPTGGETEQPTRARLLERAGRVTVVREPSLSPARLAAAVDGALALPASWGQPYRTDGADETARILQTLLDETKSP